MSTAADDLGPYSPKILRLKVAPKVEMLFLIIWLVYFRDAQYLSDR